MISNDARRTLEQDLDDLLLLIKEMLTFNEQSMNLYMNSMKKSIDQVQIHFNDTEIIQLHQNTKNSSVEKVRSFDIFEKLDENALKSISYNQLKTLILEHFQK